MSERKQAFVLRMMPVGVDNVEKALRDKHISIGWGKAAEVLNRGLDWNQFREVVRKHYYATDSNLRSAGNAAGNLWRFIREMMPGDLVAVPHGPSFYVAEIGPGEVTYDPSAAAENSAFKRDVNWLNKGRPIPRADARSGLQSRLKTQGTCARATDLLANIEECLSAGQREERPSFDADLRRRLVDTTLEEIRQGIMQGFKFERLVGSLFEAMGASVEYRHGEKDKGADLLADFLVAGALNVVVAVQAKHWQAEPPIGAEVVRQLEGGIEAESADLGIVVTSGTISKEAKSEANDYHDRTGVQIDLWDGKELARIIVDGGLQQLASGLASLS